MKIPTMTFFPGFFARWRQNAWPILTGRSEPMIQTKHEAADQAGKQAWENEGGAVKPPPYNGPKLRL